LFCVLSKFYNFGGQNHNVNTVGFLVNHCNTGTAKPEKAGGARFIRPRFAALTGAMRFRLVFRVIARRLLGGLVGQWGGLGEK